MQKEEEGVMTIKFKEATAAQACVLKMNGRFFDGRKVSPSYPAVSVNKTLADALVDLRGNLHGQGEVQAHDQRD